MQTQSLHCCHQLRRAALVRPAEVELALHGSRCFLHCPCCRLALGGGTYASHPQARHHLLPPVLAG